MPCKTFWNEVPKPFQISAYVILVVLAAFGFGLLFGWIIVWLWNWLMPMIFGLPTITFWQGVGIFVLAKILFGGVSAHNDRSDDKKSKKKKREWSFEFDSDKKEANFEWSSDKMKHKSERWEHYDEWWKAEGKASFERFAEDADALDETDVEAEMDESKNND